MVYPHSCLDACKIVIYAYKYLMLGCTCAYISNTHTQTFIYLFIYLFISIYAHVCKDAYLHVCVCVCVCVYISLIAYSYSKQVHVCNLLEHLVLLVRKQCYTRLYKVLIETSLFKGKMQRKDLMLILPTSIAQDVQEVGGYIKIVNVMNINVNTPKSVCFSRCLEGYLNILAED